MAGCRCLPRGFRRCFRLLMSLIPANHHASATDQGSTSLTHSTSRSPFHQGSPPMTVLGSPDLTVSCGTRHKLLRLSGNLDRWTDPQSQTSPSHTTGRRVRAGRSVLLPFSPLPFTLFLTTFVPTLSLCLRDNSTFSFVFSLTLRQLHSFQVEPWPFSGSIPSLSTIARTIPLWEKYRSKSEHTLYDGHHRVHHLIGKIGTIDHAGFDYAPVVRGQQRQTTAGSAIARHHVQFTIYICDTLCPSSGNSAGQSFRRSNSQNFWFQFMSVKRNSIGAKECGGIQQ